MVPSPSPFSLFFSFSFEIRVLQNTGRFLWKITSSMRPVQHSENETCCLSNADATRSDGNTCVVVYTT